jgi:cytoskeletal protein RodZ
MPRARRTGRAAVSAPALEAPASSRPTHLAGFSFSAEMPKHGEMTQISRPFQIALLAAGVLMAVWFVALRGHSPSSTSGSSGETPAATSTSTSSGSPSSVYHGSAPGVEGLSRAVAKAQGAVATSQQNAKELAQKSAQASAGTAATTTAPSAAAASQTTGAAAAAKTPAAATHKAAATPQAAATPRAASPTHGKSAGSLKSVQPTPRRQVLVERAVNEGKVAVIFFWNKRGADDVAVNAELKLLETVHHLIKPHANTPKVRRELRAYGLELDKPFTAFQARANEVTSFGTITHGVQVYGTPTIMIVNKKGQVRTITGLTDAYAIEQTIDEARHG